MDLDRLSHTFKATLPRFDFNNALVIIIASFFVWYNVVQSIVFYMAYLPIFKDEKLSEKSQRYQSLKLVGVVHSCFAAFGAVFCFFYADGQPNTTWVHCNYFKLHLFDIQKYLLCVTLGYHIQNLLSVWQLADQDHGGLRMVISLASIIQIIVALHVAGFMGTLAQIMLISQLTVPFVTIKNLLGKDTIMHKVFVALSFVVSFMFSFAWYSYLCFSELEDIVFYRGNAFWQLHDPS